MATPRVLDTKRASELFHALSDPALDSGALRHGERCVCELTDALKAAQSRLSFHLKVLKDAELVTDRKAGRWMYYTLNPKGIAAVEGSEAIKRAAFREALQLINGRIARLVALPVEQLERAALAASVREIAEVEQPLPAALDRPANQEH